MIGAKDDKTEEGAPEGGHSSRRKWLKLLIGLIIVAVAANWILGPSNFPAVNRSVWQSVFLDNNQVYFGHLRNYNRDYVVLSNIFYLRAAEPPQPQPSEGPTLNLVKLGGELHGPQDEMYIPKGKIMFWENLKSDSQVTQAINTFLAEQK